MLRQAQRNKVKARPHVIQGKLLDFATLRLK